LIITEALDDIHRFANVKTIKSINLPVIRAGGYTSQAYQDAVMGKGITMSMSRKDTPVDNGPIESIHSTLKSENVLSRRFNLLDDSHR
jgi:transposase InsO family protein